MTPRRLVGARCVLVMAVLAVTFLASPPAGFAHQDHRATTTTQPLAPTPGAGPVEEEPGMDEPGMEEGHPDEPAHAEEPMESSEATPRLEMRVPKEAELGDDVRLEARLTGPDGAPMADEPITFLSEAQWGEEFQGEMVVGVARTDADGVAVLVLSMRRSGDVSFHAELAADAEHPGVEAGEVTLEVEGTAQLITPRIGLRVPGLGVWVLMALVAGLWGLYLLTAAHLVRVVRAGPAVAHATVAGESEGLVPASSTRRRFLREAAVPAGLAAFIAAFGSGILALIARSPRTHGNIHRYASTSAYRRTPFARISGDVVMPELPPLLERTVSFTDDVLPVLAHRGGPHAVLPKNSPPPAGVRFDSYEGLMEKEGLVVPGRPEESLLVQVLLEPAMRMPPSTPPLPEEEIQIIASWIAQGAQPA